MLTGVRKNKHGVVGNDFANNNLETFPLMYERVKAAQPESDIRVFTTSTIFNSNLTAGVDVSEVVSNDVAVKDRIINSLSEGDVTMITGHFTSVDRAGAQ